MKQHVCRAQFHPKKVARRDSGDPSTGFRGCFMFATLAELSRQRSIVVFGPLRRTEKGLPVAMGRKPSTGRRGCLAFGRTRRLIRRE